LRGGRVETPRGDHVGARANPRFYIYKIVMAFYVFVAGFAAVLCSSNHRCYCYCQLLLVDQVVASEQRSRPAGH
jgi:hypothetical protein